MTPWGYKTDKPEHYTEMVRVTHSKKLFVVSNIISCNSSVTKKRVFITLLLDCYN